MKLYLDSANLNDIREALDSGAISGITTNPTLMAKELGNDGPIKKRAYSAHLREIVKLTQGRIPVSIEVLSTDPVEMLVQARMIHKDFPGAVIKIPVGWQELGIISDLSAAGIPVNATCLFTTRQAVMAINAGARYVSFFYNRMIDCQLKRIGLVVGGYNEKEMDLAASTARQAIQDTRKLIGEPLGIGGSIICGSIRQPRDVIDCWLAGADIVTASLPIIKALCGHPGTTESIEKFMADLGELQG
jgi:transaldolase